MAKVQAVEIMSSYDASAFAAVRGLSWNAGNINFAKTFCAALKK
jgi:hypothetical protein